MRTIPDAFFRMMSSAFGADFQIQRIVYSKR